MELRSSVNVVLCLILVLVLDDVTSSDTSVASATDFPKVTAFLGPMATDQETHTIVMGEHRLEFSSDMLERLDLKADIEMCVSYPFVIIMGLFSSDWTLKRSVLYHMF